MSLSPAQFNGPFGRFEGPGSRASAGSSVESHGSSGPPAGGTHSVVLQSNGEYIEDKLMPVLLCAVRLGPNAGRIQTQKHPDQRSCLLVSDFHA